MLLKKLGTAASVIAAIGMAFPMAVGFTSQPGGSQTTAVSSTDQHQYRTEANNEAAADLVNDIQNAKINKYQTMIELKIQEAKQSSESHKVVAGQSKASKTEIHEVKQPVVKAEKPVKETKKVAAVKDESAVKPEVTVKRQTVATVKKTSVVKQAVKPAKVARTDSESVEAKATTSHEVQKKVPEASEASKTVKPQTTVKPAAEHSEATASAKKSRSSAAPQQQTYRTPQQSTATVQSTSGSSATFTLTAYSLKGTTATGVNLTANPNAKVVAVDPNVIPLGSAVTIPGLGTFTAADTGGAIQGHRIDVHMPSTQAALNFGVRSMQVTVNR